jgi:Regulator of chromosome condensation (RCC1) repeat
MASCCFCTNVIRIAVRLLLGRTASIIASTVTRYSVGSTPGLPVANYTVELGNATVSDVACGSSHTCALLDLDNNTAVNCWGYNTYLQLVRARLTDTFCKVYDLCALHLQCCQCFLTQACYLMLLLSNKQGNGRNPAVADASKSIAVEFGKGVVPKAISSGGWQSCAITDGPYTFKDRLFCWGSDNSDYPYYGQVHEFLQLFLCCARAQPVLITASY